MSEDTAAQPSTPEEKSFTEAMTVDAKDAVVKAAAEATAHDRANTLLLGAISSGDPKMFAQAVREKADVNFGGGKPLQKAAEANNALMLRLLVTHGADIRHAVKTMTDEQAGIPRKQKYRDTYYRTGVYYTYKSKEEEQRWKQLNSAVKVLNEYEETYLAKIAPVEAVRLQQQVLNELRELKEEVMTALHGKQVDKPRLRAPVAVQQRKRSI